MTISKTNSINILGNAIEVFKNINKRIQSLIECSAKDFDTLNQNFRNYYLKIKDLTEKASSIFQSIHELDENWLESSIFELKKWDANLRESFRFITSIETTIQQSEKEIAYSYLHVNNILQNIGTLRLLATNIQFEPNYRSFYKELNQIIETLNTCSHHLEKDFQNLDRRIKHCAETTVHIKSRQIPSLLHAVQLLTNSLLDLQNRKLECPKYRNRLGELISKKSASSSEIITNLQFQDIIRQKIEHVQDAHTVLLNELSASRDLLLSTHTNEEQISSSILQKIRDIGSLQAAQLIHANNEYQKAIENITEMFGELDYTLAGTLNILKKLTLKDETNNELLFHDLYKNYSLFTLESDSLSKDNSELFHSFSDLQLKEETLFNSKNKTDCILENTSYLIGKLTSIQGINSMHSQLVNPIHQLVNNLQKFKKSMDEIEDILQTEKKKLTNLSEVNISPYLKLFENTLKNSVDINQLLDFIVPNKIILKIEENSYWKENETNSQFSLEEVKYYKVFDKEIECIIEMLNGFIETLNIDGIISNLDKTELEKLQKLYTMDSERRVHEIYTGSKTKSTDQHDEIELF